MKRIITRIACLLGFFGGIATTTGDDIIISDFEGDDYGQWEVTGEAFGEKPAGGTLDGQQTVSGFHGEGLVNTFRDGDGTTGTLTSPPFKIERSYITFLIGGGSHKSTSLRLLIDGKVIASRSGRDDERLVRRFFNVNDHQGKTARLRIVDEHTGGWGHINVDHIVQTNTKPDVPVIGSFSREFTINKGYLIIPIQNGAKKTQLELCIDGKAVRRYSTPLATNGERVDWHAFFTIARHKGKQATVRVDNAPMKGFKLIRQANRVPSGEVPWYEEKLRPQFHFSQKVGWNNDPNGMTYHEGEWHLFFQHNPVGIQWGNMTWGHAVSKDLIHWKQLPNTLFPRTMAQGACFSGGGNVDKRNTAGFQHGVEPPLVAFLTDTGAGEAVAYSNDRGRTFTWYEKNPVVEHEGRDPKVIWYEYDAGEEPLNDKAEELGGHWVMVVFDQHPDHGRNTAFYTSTNLKDWTEQSHLIGYFECPELFELPVQGNPDRTRWVTFAADARYALGQFDGRRFKPTHEGKHRVHYGNYYASQTFANAPNGRRIQMGWAQIKMPGMPFNQTFTFPHRLTLRKTDDGIRMFAQPIKEIQKLHKRTHTAKSKKLTNEKAVVLDVSGELFDINATFKVQEADQVGLDIGGEKVIYHANKQQLNRAALVPEDGKITVRVLLDRPMKEIIGNDGAVYITQGRGEKGEVGTIRAFARGGDAKLLRLEVHELKSIWRKDR